MKKRSDHTPDEITLTLWMDGELEGDALEKVESWARNHPEVLAEREAVQAVSASIRANLPASIEPPYADFFNQRILRHIDDETSEPAAVTRPSFWQQFGRWLAIPVAAAAMAVCFYVGTQVGEQPESAATTYTVATVPTVYTPDGDVSADMFKSEDADAVIIVLEGLEDIPDDFDIVGEPRHSRSDQSGAVMVNTRMTF